jgi:hypothetical protein
VDLGGLAKYGVFTVRFGKGDRLIPFWDEVASEEATSTVTIYWHESSFVRGRTVRTLETSTVQGLYLTMNAEEPLVATIRTLANLCLEIQDGAHLFEKKLRAFPEVPIQARSPARFPSNFEVGRFTLGKLARSARLRWQTRGKEGQWFVAMRPNSLAHITNTDAVNLGGFKEVSLPSGTGSMADPFLWDSGGRTYLFFEEVATGSSRGRLACIEVLGDGSFSKMQIILDQPYHLSYPCVVEDRGELFLLPEASEVGRVDLYRFSRFPSEVELVAPLVQGLALVDTTPIFLNDRWYFFTTTLQPFMETLLFWSNRLEGAWNLHPCSPISCSVKNSRSAGNLFWMDGRLYRPTQDCSVRYGYAIQVNEIIRLTPTEFEERTVNRVLPVWQPGLLGTHTWNQSRRVQVIDGYRLMNRSSTAAPDSVRDRA